MKARIYDANGDYVYRIDGNYIYRSGGGYCVYEINGNYIYRSGGGYYAYKMDGNYIYDFDGNYIYRIDGNYIYRSGGGYYVYRIEGKINDNANDGLGAGRIVNQIDDNANGGFGVGESSSGCLGTALGVGLALLVLFVIVGLVIAAWPTFFEQLLDTEDREQFFSQLFYLFLLVLSHIISIVISVKNEEFSFKTVWLRTVLTSIVCAGVGYWIFYTIFEGYTFGVLFASIIMTGAASATTALIAVAITKMFKK
ncbi:hypothetical protein [Blautia sp. 1033sp1_1033st1_G9_1033SCRN_220408]|uniref:hypothetical protein n=1 Tax=Blautia sp. 1033sp1_1033st1_G9_1033SCRN_220408 TaxID=3144490 RepID=UPI0034A559FA